MGSPKFPCSRYGGSNMLFNESRANSKAWWKRLFEIMVKEVCVPPHLCVEVLKEIFPNKIFECICTIMGIEPKPLKPVASDKNIQEMAKHFLKPNYLSNSKKNRLIEELNLNMAESKETSKFSNVLKERDMKMNAYLNFRRKNDQIEICNKTIKLSVAARIITEKIAHDFVKWLKECEKNVKKDIIKIFKLFKITFAFPLNEDSDSSSEDVHAAQKKKSKLIKIHKKQSRIPKNPTPKDSFEYHTILKMFEIGLSNEITTSVVVDMKEIPMTRLKKVFELAEEEALLAKRTEETKVMHYFHTRIPNRPVQYCKSNLVQKLDSMEVTFKDITHLRSVKSYCKWLINNPDKERPEFLKMENMFDLVTLNKSDESIAIIDDKNII